VMETIIGSDLVQYGFAGFAFVLAGVIAYLFKCWREDSAGGRKDLMDMGRETTDMLRDTVDKNTAAFVSHRESLNGLREATKENTEVLRKINGKAH